MVGTRGEGEKRKEENKGRKKGLDPSPLTLFSPFPSSHTNGEGPPKFMPGIGGEGEGEKDNEEKKDRKKCSLALSYFLWVEGPITCWLIHVSERGL